MTFPRLKHITDGNALIITDLHGTGDIWDNIRAYWEAQHKAGELQHLIICGDMIHGYGTPENDHSLRMMLEIIELTEIYGHDHVHMILGNHEMPHIYNITLAKGNMEFTAQFEKALVKAGEDIRQRVVDYFIDLPFYITSDAGIAFAHAGAPPNIDVMDILENIVTIDHRAILHLAQDQLQSNYDLTALKSHTDYQEQVRYFLTIKDVEHPRYSDFLRGQLISQTMPDFELMWNVLFTQNEHDHSRDEYFNRVNVFLKQLSVFSPKEQRALVSGHISVRNGGHQVLSEQILRLASYKHAKPNTAGQVLMIDLGKPLKNTNDLLDKLILTESL